MITTYNTGKVQIGLRYVKPPQQQSEDADRLQAWLLSGRSAWRLPNWVRRVWGWL